MDYRTTSPLLLPSDSTLYLFATLALWQMMAATTRDKRIMATITATKTPAMTGAGDSLDEETSSVLPPPFSAVEVRDFGIGVEVGWG